MFRLALEEQRRSSPCRCWKRILHAHRSVLCKRRELTISSPEEEETNDIDSARPTLRRRRVALLFHQLLSFVLCDHWSFEMPTSTSQISMTDCQQFVKLLSHSTICSSALRLMCQVISDGKLIHYCKLHLQARCCWWLCGCSIAFGSCSRRSRTYFLGANGSTASRRRCWDVVDLLKLSITNRSDTDVSQSVSTVYWSCCFPSFVRTLNCDIHPTRWRFRFSFLVIQAFPFIGKVSVEYWEEEQELLENWHNGLGETRCRNLELTSKS